MQTTTSCQVNLFGQNKNLLFEASEKKKKVKQNEKKNGVCVEKVELLLKEVLDWGNI